MILCRTHRNKQALLKRQSLYFYLYHYGKKTSGGLEKAA